MYIATAARLLILTHNPPCPLTPVSAGAAPRAAARRLQLPGGGPAQQALQPGQDTDPHQPRHVLQARSLTDSLVRVFTVCLHSEPECEEKCRTVTETKCRTRSEQQCAAVEEEKCFTVDEQRCATVNENQCSTVNEQQCSTGEGCCDWSKRASLIG